jgi:DNA (cytosine-5)-methyltransferase 1
MYSKEESLTHLDLFSGIGGFALAAKWVGISTVGFCELDEPCIKVLKKNFPGVHIHKDIKSLNGEKYEKVDIITGGYPCQPFSVAGSQKAQEDDRHLWPEMRRVIAQAKPKWVVCENVLGHIRLGLDDVLFDLESLGYSTQSFVVPAVAAGANHRRDRVFIVAYSSSHGRNESSATGSNGTANGGSAKRGDKDSDNERRGSVWAGVDWGCNQAGGRGTKPPPLRVDDGLPGRMDRNKMLGNAVDPRIVKTLLLAISRIERKSNA